MQCEKCNVEMIKGSLFNHGSLWTDKVFHAPVSKLMWILNGFNVINRVTAHKCPNCNQIKLKAETN